MKKGFLMAVALGVVMTGCSWQQAKQSAPTPKYDPSTLEKAEREQVKALHGPKATEQMNIDARMAELKAMFAERNAYNRNPVAARAEGKSQGSGDCRQVTVQARGVPLSVFLKNVAGKRTLRIMPDEDLVMDQPVNVSADKECDEDVIDRVLTSLDVAYTINDDVLTVKSRETKSYQLPILATSKQYSSSTQTSGVSGSSTGSGSSGSGSSGGSAGAGGGRVTHTSIEVDEFDELKEQAKALLLSERSKVTVNKTDGTLIALARPSEQRAIEKLIASYQKNMADNAVMVTAKILEVNADDLEEHGLSMDMLLNRVKGGLQVLTGFAGQVQGSPATIRAFNTQGSTLFDIQSALRDYGIRFRQRVAPSVTVANRRGAVINMGGQEQYVKSIELSATNATNGTSTLVPSPKLDILQTGVQLDVMPTIMDDEKIMAQVRISITDKTGEKTFNFTNVGSFNSPILSTREINTMIPMRDGGTVVLSGLTREFTSNSSDGLPWIGRAPVAGNLFAHKKKQTTRSEALVFLTMKSLGHLNKYASN